MRKNIVLHMQIQNNQANLAPSSFIWNYIFRSCKINKELFDENFVKGDSYEFYLILITGHPLTKFPSKFFYSFK